jgi:hypothetical protein
MMGYRDRPGVRLTHLPTGLAAECTSERSMHKCQVAALRLLRARLARHRELGGPHPAAAEVVREYDGMVVAAEDQRTLWRERVDHFGGLGAEGLARMLAVHVRQTGG